MNGSIVVSFVQMSQRVSSRDGHEFRLPPNPRQAHIGWPYTSGRSRYIQLLDLGGDGPEAIALAVIAEAQACCMGRLGASRRLSAEDVARHVSEGGASRYLQVHCALDIAR